MPWQTIRTVGVNQLRRRPVESCKIVDASQPAINLHLHLNLSGSCVEHLFGAIGGTQCWALKHDSFSASNCFLDLAGIFGTTSGGSHARNVMSKTERSNYSAVWHVRPRRPGQIATLKSGAIVFHRLFVLLCHPSSVR